MNTPFPLKEHKPYIALRRYIIFHNNKKNKCMTQYDLFVFLLLEYYEIFNEMWIYFLGHPEFVSVKMCLTYSLN